MHEFFCCEAIPAQALSAGEVAIPLGTLFYGGIYLSLHAANVNSRAIDLSCKSKGTCLDVLTSCGGAVATSPINMEGFCFDALNHIVNMDTCLIW